MFGDFLKQHITSQANYVEYGYGQVEPNLLSAQRNGKIYGQLPANKNINILEQGQFVKYDYAKGELGEACFDGAGEWMLVYNEIKLYHDNQVDCEFALIKDDYKARIYSPASGDTNFSAQSRFYNGKDNANNTSITVGSNTYAFDDVTKSGDYYEPHYNDDPFHIESKVYAQKMPTGTTMIPRVFKTDIGDVMTTNTINATDATTHVITRGAKLVPNATGILTETDDVSSAEMVWQVVKVYTMPDHQRGVKIQRIK